MTLALETQGLVKTFGGLTATRDLSLKVERGARHALIGPNGAGKTTVINLLTGVLRPNTGRILLEGNDITAVPVAPPCADGPVAHVPDQPAVRRSDAAGDHCACGLRAARRGHALVELAGARCGCRQPKSRRCCSAFISPT